MTGNGIITWVGFERPNGKVSAVLVTGNGDHEQAFARAKELGLVTRGKGRLTTITLLAHEAPATLHNRLLSLPEAVRFASAYDVRMAALVGMLHP
jgi:hypothetical protein